MSKAGTFPENGVAIRFRLPSSAQTKCSPICFANALFRPLLMPPTIPIPRNTSNHCAVGKSGEDLGRGVRVCTVPNPSPTTSPPGVEDDLLDRSSNGSHPAGCPYPLNIRKPVFMGKRTCTPVQTLPETIPATPHIPALLG